MKRLYPFAFLRGASVPANVFACYLVEFTSELHAEHLHKRELRGDKQHATLPRAKVDKNVLAVLYIEPANDLEKKLRMGSQVEVSMLDAVTCNCQPPKSYSAACAHSVAPVENPTASLAYHSSQNVDEHQNLNVIAAKLIG